MELHLNGNTFADNEAIIVRAGQIISFYSYVFIAGKTFYLARFMMSLHDQ